MRPFAHRDPGPIGATLADGEMVAGLICDGIHVDPIAVRMAWRALGPDRLNLVTDAVAVLGSEPGASRLGSVEVSVDGGGVRTASGVLAGSDLVARPGRAQPGRLHRLLRARRRANRHRNSGPAARPPRSGALEPGARADVTVLVGRPGGRRHGRRRRGGMEVVITPTADDAARVVADVIVHLVERATRARCSDWRPGARRSAPTACSSPTTGPGGSTSRPATPSCSTSTSACPLITPRRTAP